MTLEEAFALRPREVISLVGGGGKTSLLFALGEELSSRGRGTLLTTTTKIWEPSPSPSFALLLADRLPEAKAGIRAHLGRRPYLLAACRRLPDGKLEGIPPEWITEFLSLPDLSAIIVEADGSKGRSLKAPRPGEPVLPPRTTLLVPVIGIDALGRPLDERYVFRAEIASRLLGLPLGSQVTERAAARLLSFLLQGRPPEARIVPFINKIDLPAGPERARILAQALFGLEGAPVERVLLGQARNSPAVREVLFKS
ncbi:MAG: putative selenium-dependent hydroxylase accessory protein YqeC [Deltaproteobacteria bacterium]|nr:putative selenium-dependent hydroxylase accessory protein YqeC [Deltaproteobacteria bacterium]